MSYRIMPTGEKFVEKMSVFLAQFQPNEPKFPGEIMIMTFPLNIGDLSVFEKGQRKKTKSIFVPEIVFQAKHIVTGNGYKLEWFYHSYQLVKHMMPTI